MARLSRSRDHTLLGHAPRDPFASAGASPYPPYRNSEVDFSDVFGGPPRRSSIGHTRLGPGESPGGRGIGGVGEELDAAPRRPWSCSLGEAPVFGGIGSPTRRRQAGDGFFKDIFTASYSACSTLGKMDRDLFSSNLSSRVLSPARPLPPASDMIGGGSALPASLSFSTRPSKGSDYPAYGSHTPDVAHRNEKSTSDVLGSSPVACAPTSYGRLVQTKDNPRSETHASLNESALLYKTPHNQYRSLEATRLAHIETNDPKRKLKNDSSGLQTHSDYDHFHFSMYKWASVGVTLVMPYSLKERTKNETKASGVSVQVSQSADSPTDKSMPKGHGIIHTQCDLEDRNQLSGPAAEGNHDVNLRKEVKEAVPASSNTKSVCSDTTDKSGDIDTCSKNSASVHVKAWKPELKNLSQLLNGYSDKEGDKGRTGQTRNKEGVVVDYSTKMNDVHDTAKVAQTISENMFWGHTGKSVKKRYDTLAAREDKMVGSPVKGKVKEFIKIFNQEPAPRSDGTIESHARRPRTRNKARESLETHVSARVANADEHEKKKIDNETLSTSPMAANQNLGIGERPASDRSLSMQKMDDSSSEVKSVSSDQAPATLDASFSNIAEAYIENIDECLVQENQNEVTEADVYQDEIKKSDAKIQEWSKGKEGNIRSLLSTLQYVLWPGSGWKPVPLVDIIEGTSVRRAYQKALLCLHPDKLQQKGAEMHQKYIAEKVFDILQEAWIHFNSVSSL